MNCEQRYCDDYSGCYLLTEHCDGVKNCLDGSDERDCPGIRTIFHGKNMVYTIATFGILYGILMLVCYKRCIKKDNRTTQTTEEGTPLQPVPPSSTNASPTVSLPSSLPSRVGQPMAIVSRLQQRAQWRDGEPPSTLSTYSQYSPVQSYRGGGASVSLVVDSALSHQVPHPRAPHDRVRVTVAIQEPVALPGDLSVPSPPPSYEEVTLTSTYPVVQRTTEPPPPSYESTLLNL